MTCLDKADNALQDVAVICGFDADEMLQELNRALEKAKQEKWDGEPTPQFYEVIVK